jgi:hypothetical protein
VQRSCCSIRTTAGWTRGSAMGMQLRNLSVGPCTFLYLPSNSFRSTSINLGKYANNIVSSRTIRVERDSRFFSHGISLRHCLKNLQTRHALAQSLPSQYGSHSFFLSRYSPSARENTSHPLRSKLFRRTLHISFTLTHELRRTALMNSISTRKISLVSWDDAPDESQQQCPRPPPCDERWLYVPGVSYVLAEMSASCLCVKLCEPFLA